MVNLDGHGVVRTERSAGPAISGEPGQADKPILNKERRLALQPKVRIQAVPLPAQF
jgi:hypothetical protein